MSTSRCPGCGCVLPAVEGPTHAYLESSPACWAAYGAVLAREYSDPALFGRLHRLTVDAYAVQHPGRESARSTQSVCSHLISLGAVLEQGATHAHAKGLIEAAVRAKGRLRWLPPPASPGAVTVVDVLRAERADLIAEKVGQWANSAWSAWSAHHAVVRGWIAGLRAPT